MKRGLGMALVAATNIVVEVTHVLADVCLIVFMKARSAVATGFGNGHAPDALAQALKSGILTAPQDVVNPYEYNIFQGKSGTNYMAPKVIDGTSIAKPRRIKAQCKCLNIDGSVDKTPLYTMDAV